MARTRLRDQLKRVRGVWSWVWPKLRTLLIVLIAISMAEYVALDVGLVLAADIMLYIEIVLGVWAMALISRLMPGVAGALMLIFARAVGSVDTMPSAELEKGDHLGHPLDADSGA